MYRATGCPCNAKEVLEVYEEYNCPLHSSHADLFLTLRSGQESCASRQQWHVTKSGARSGCSLAHLHTRRVESKFYFLYSLYFHLILLLILEDVEVWSEDGELAASVLGRARSASERDETDDRGHGPRTAHRMISSSRSVVPTLEFFIYCQTATREKNIPLRYPTTFIHCFFNQI